MVEEHLLGRWEDRLWLLGCPRIQLVFGDEAQFFNKVLLSNALLDQLLQLFSEGDRDDAQIGYRRVTALHIRRPFTIIAVDAMILHGREKKEKGCSNIHVYPCKTFHTPIENSSM